MTQYSPELNELRERLEAVKAINRNGATWRNGKDIEFLLVHKGHPYRHWEIEHAEFQKADKEEIAEQYEKAIKAYKFFRHV